MQKFVAILYIKRYHLISDNIIENVGYFYKVDILENVLDYISISGFTLICLSFCSK